MSLFSENHNVGMCGTVYGVLSFVYCTAVMLSYNTGVETLSQFVIRVSVLVLSLYPQCDDH
jgi:hypothetical protein